MSIPQNNFLILTPDGVGSTYLQRALTVYLQSADLDYWNTHELLRGLAVKRQRNLHVDWQAGYTQTVPDICEKLQHTDNAIVSRIAHYHVQRRLQLRDEDYTPLYEQCHRKFATVVLCERDPFEYALSWSIRNTSGRLNVYTIQERQDTHQDRCEPVDLAFFRAKLAEYQAYELWAANHFAITHTVNYDDLHRDVDQVMQRVTAMTHTTFLQQYSRLRYLASRNQYRGESLEPMLEMHAMIDRLYRDRRLPTRMPLKGNTMTDKQQRVSNFSQAVDTYNRWASTGNRHPQLTDKRLQNTIAAEQAIYATT